MLLLILVGPGLWPSLSAAPAGKDAHDPAPAVARAFLDQKCTGCHAGAKAPAGLDFTSISFQLDDGETFNRWVRIHDAVRSGKMPPGGSTARNEPASKLFLKTIAEPMIAHERTRTLSQGRSVLRRLNRYEYENTVRALLAAPWLQLRSSLPEDGIISRFNKVGQALDVSHVQMARYIETAEQAIRLTIDASLEPEVTRRYYAREQERFLHRMRYSPFNRSPERATIPILGFEAQPDVLAEKVPITVGEKDPAMRELEGFATPASTYTGNEYHWDQFKAPAGGTYQLRLNAHSLWIHTLLGPEGKPEQWWRPNREKTSRGRTTEPVTLYALSTGGEKRLLGSFDVTPEPAVLEMVVHLLPGERIMPDASRLFRSRPGWVGNPLASEEGTPGVAYRWMEVKGPLANAAITSGLFAGLQLKRSSDGSIAVEPAAPVEADRLLREFLTAAYRRSPTPAELERYLQIVQKRLESSHNFMEAMVAGYTAVLCSPGFLYLEETPGTLRDGELAARLSYFLWNAPPDDELMALAAKGLLKRPATLRAQTDRLLADDRSRQFTDAFLDYWLDLRKLNETTPDVILYPDYYLDDLLTESALSETQLFFRHLIRNNLPVSNIVDSRFTVLNSHLARHYGLPPVDGVAMRVTALPPGSERGGLLTQASILKVTANGTTTSPVLRGVWIAERILGDPVPPPPPGTPAVEPDTRGATTIRQQLDKHRSNASCAGCHNKIDPPGFALEAFDVLGGRRDRYRSTEEGEAVAGVGKNGHAFAFRKSQPVDASGQLANGEKFQDVAGLKQVLLKDERQIARSMAKQFIVYATGAPVSFADRDEVERLLTASEPQRYRMRTLIHQVVQSRLFRSK